MLLPWLNVEVNSVSELLWYMRTVHPGEDRTSGDLVNEVLQGHNHNSQLTLPPETITMKSPPPSLYALIIGIGRYKANDINNLSGAVPDAKAVQGFLQGMGVGQDRIITLLDAQATRDAILGAIQDLMTNPAISREDPILIYYAGHGAQAPPPSTGWATGNSTGLVQMLLPHDFAYWGSKTRDGQGIFDVILSRMLTELAKKKSDNITVILDSCHSGSGTRKHRGDETLASRGVKLPSNYSIPANVLRSELEDRGTFVAPGYEMAGLRSHVLLAACKQDQQAIERGGRGVFTSALVKLLEKDGIDKLTYQDVIARLPDLPYQNPQCEGVNQTRVLFNSKVAPPYQTLYRIRPNSTLRNEFRLEAGEAHGLTNGMEFAIYPDRTLSGPPLGSVTIARTLTFTSNCVPTSASATHTIPDGACALQTRVGSGQDIRLFVPLDVSFLDLFGHLSKAMQRTNPNNRSFQLVDTIEDSPDIAISFTGNRLVQFDVMESICRQYGMKSLPFRNIRPDEAEYLFSILCSAADFYWKLHHSNKITSTSLVQAITLDCFKVVPSGKYTADLDDILIPDPRSENLNINGTIIIDVEENAKYGYKITNASKTPLYAALFYFDVSDMSIGVMYSPGVARLGDVEYSIPAGGSLTIGFGDSGTPPYKYFLRADQAVDVGFLKLCLSTKFIDNTAMAQASPFKAENSLRGVKLEHVKHKRRELWDTMIIPVVQKRGKALRTMPKN
ncbi:caspase domain-containing protein [Coprinopsis sp. MPI-PUGE-AT-0042]|nr:caspase domain-containing protein [Coprinopsis sp. MPI-PUGE-AT-0042]